ATPLSNGYSPAQLRIAFAPHCLSFQRGCKPALPDLQSLQHKERVKRWMDAKCFNKRHRARDLANLSPGDHVWISDAKAQGTVTSTHTPQPTVLPHQRTTKDTEEESSPSSVDTSVRLWGRGSTGALTRSGHFCRSRFSDFVASNKISEPGVMRMRSGREIIKPQRLNL
ncbi:hypothetical protein LDENG_00228130, partial [Lucifuga dentata]